MPSVMIRENDQIMMSLVHYFVTKENYAPIHVQGVQDEIWLENLEGPYRVIRINCNRVINEEQFKFDLFKMEHVLKQIKKKTLSFKINALNICLDMSKKVDVKEINHINTIMIDSLDEAKESSELKEAFPEINDNLIETNDGLDLIINVTNDINEKTEKENRAFAKVFSPKKIIFTKVIMLLCVIMYFVLAIYGQDFINFSPSLVALFGGNNIVLIKSGQIWRIITSAFIHVGLIHLIINMYSLAILGTQVETFIGKFKFVFIYLISAISGSLLSLVFSAENIISAGASGAIFGLMGALLYFGYHYRLYLNETIRSQIIPIIIMNLFIGFVIGGVDNACHIGGLIGGYLASMAVGIENKSTTKDSINGWIVLILYIVFLSCVIFFVK